MTVAQEKNTAQENVSPRCFARRHMPVADSAYHAYALAVSRQSGIFYSDDRRDAEEFGRDGISKTTVYNIRRELEAAGWFVRIDRGKRAKRNPRTGQVESIRYKVLSHDQWIAQHPNSCRFPSEESEPDPPGNESKTEGGTKTPDPNSGTGPDPESGTGDVALSQELVQACTKTPKLPVPEFGAKTESTRQKEPLDRKERAAETAAVESTGLPDWVPSDWNEFLQMRRKKPLTTRAKNLLLERLTELRDAGNDPAQVLRQSIRAGYPDLYECKLPRVSPGQKTRRDHLSRFKRNLETAGLTPADWQ